MRHVSIIPNCARSDSGRKSQSLERHSFSLYTLVICDNQKMSVTFQLQSFTPVGTSQTPLQRLRHQRAFCCRNDQDRECQSQSCYGLASLSGAFLSGSVPPARLCASLQRRTARHALTTCQATAEKQTIAVTGANITKSISRIP